MFVPCWSSRTPQIPAPSHSGAHAHAPTMTTRILRRLDAHDRQLFVRWRLDASATQVAVHAWTWLTRLGGLWCSLAAATLPLTATGLLHEAAERSLGTLVASHLLVQLLKRSVGRPRPSRTARCNPFTPEPDRFSFPSGHAAAAMSVAFGYAISFPTLAAPLLVVASAVGMSRVCLGVHYPGDVFAGQALALLAGGIWAAVP